MTDNKKKLRLPSWKSVGSCTIVYYVDVIVGAVIVQDGKVLCAKRASEDEFHGLWEIPGGAVEPGERHEFALIRICEEKLGVPVSVEKKFTSFRHDLGTQVLNYVYYEVTIDSGVPQSMGYNGLAWIPFDALQEQDFVPADQMVIPALRERQGFLKKAYP